MPKNKHHKDKKKAAPKELSPNALTYHGPIVMKGAKQEEDLNTTVFSWSGTFSSTSGAVLNAVFAADPSSSGDWASASAVWKEFRVLGWDLLFAPSNRYSKSTTVCNPISGVVDRTSSSPLSSYTQAMDFASHRILSLEDPWSFKVTMQTVAEAEFQSVGSYTVFTWIKFYGDSLSVSTTYGRLFIRWRVQFRGRA